MIRRRLSLLLAVLALAVAPAWAGSTRLVLLASAAQTATGNSAAMPVASIKELAVYVDITAASGTSPTLALFIQTSSDDGTTWFDMPYDLRLTDNNASATQGSGGVPAGTDLATSAGAPVENTRGGRNINGVTSLAAVARLFASYHAFGDKIRVRWVIGGTTPSFTFSVRGIGK